MAESQPTRTSTFELRDYFRIVWSRKWTAFFILLVVVGGIMFLSYRQIPIYQSKVELIPIVAPDVGGSTAIGASRNVDLETEAARAGSEAIATKVAEALKLDVDPTQLLKFMAIAPVRNGQILLFQAQHPNPERAAALAQEFAHQYLQVRLDTTLTPFINAKEQNAADAKTINSQLLALGDQTPEEAPEITHQREQLRAALDAATNQVRVNNQAIDLIKADAQTAILQNARVSHHPVRPDHFRDAIFAVIIGLALGIGAAFLRDYADDSLRGPDDLERQAGAPLLGVIPHVSSRVAAKGRRSEQYLVSVADPKAPATESYRTLRTNLLFFSVGGPIRRLLITSPVKGEGKSTTAANLATVMALAGQRVLLVGADLRRPSIHKFFGLSNRVGLSSVLSGQASLMEAIQDPGVKGLRVMAGGPVPPNPAELLGSVAMRQFLEQAADAADWVILDGPPVLGLADASVLGTMSEAVLLVVNEATNRRVLAHARDQLAKVRSRVVGAVLNNFGPATSYYYYADYYAYTSSYYYESEPEEKGRRKRKERKERKAKDAATSEPKRRRGKADSNGNGFDSGIDMETETVEVAASTPNGKVGVLDATAAPETAATAAPEALATSDPEALASDPGALAPEPESESTTSFFK